MMFIFCNRSCVLTVATALTGALLSMRRTDVLEWFPWQDMCKGVRPCWKKKAIMSMRSKFIFFSKVMQN